jgi:hypothetical protein
MYGNENAVCSTVGLHNVAEFRPTVRNFHISSRLDVTAHRMLFGGTAGFM